MSREPAKDRPPERAGCVIGIAAGLLLILGLLVGLVLFDARTIDAQGLAAEVFAAEELPHGFAASEAAKLPDGQRIVRITRTSEETDSVEAPEELVLTLYPSPAAAKARLAPPAAGGPPGMAFAPDRSLEWQKNPTFDFEKRLEGGHLTWSGWQAPFVRDRKYTAQGTWRDEITINLSTPSQGRILLLLYRHETDASSESARRFLELLQPRFDSPD